MDIFISDVPAENIMAIPHDRYGLRLSQMSCSILHDPWFHMEQMMFDDYAIPIEENIMMKYSNSISNTYIKTLEMHLKYSRKYSTK